MKHRILLDSREFVQGRSTGIGRVLEGLLDVLPGNKTVEQIILASFANEEVPKKIINRNKIILKKIPNPFLKSEKALSDLTKKHIHLFISPYPKLPLFGCYCPSIHIIHDVLDLTHPAYRKRFKVFFDGFRLKTALKKADLSWYDSRWSLEETKNYAGYAGKNPRVRSLGVSEKFNTEPVDNHDEVFKRYKLNPGYILVIGNGLPHKNLGVLLRLSKQLPNGLLFVGTPEKNKKYWKSRFPNTDTLWIQHVNEEDLPVVIKGAFCVAQPSTAEGYGYPPLEAMACGVPVVVSKIPVLIETTGGNALVADPRDPETWINAFEYLKNTEIYKKQVEIGLRWTESLRGPQGWQGHISDIEELLGRS